jgi:hypothetical protein
MSVFSNKHVVVAVLVAPVLAIVAYFGLDLLVGEKPQAAVEGHSYPLAEKPNCRYESGQCELKNADFELRMITLPLGDDRVSLTLESVFPLEGVLVALVEQASDKTPPVAMRQQGADGTTWSLDIPRPDPERHRLRLVASAGGTLYYGDVATQFTLGDITTADTL